MTKKSMIVAGVMSGTSADGIDVAIMRITEPAKRSARGQIERPRLKLLAHEGFPYSAALRRSVLSAMNAASISTAALARLNWRLGLAYADAVSATLGKNKIKLDLIGCHGQTLYHQARPERYAGRSFACTWQAGEMAPLVNAIKVPVVSNFRPADMVAGGQGAPLVPLLDYVLFADPLRGRVLQNVGGIANLTGIPPGASPVEIIAFDTGPGNMVIDALVQQLAGRRYDRNGAMAARGRAIDTVLTASLRDRYFRVSPPRTAGREQYGREYSARFLEACKSAGGAPADAVATATTLTAESIAQSYCQYVMPQMKDAPVDFIVSGGGARNATLMGMLRARLEPQGCMISMSAGFGLPVEAKEAAAFALLAWQTWHRRHGNIPAATGAAHPAILGQVAYV